MTMSVSQAQSRRQDGQHEMTFVSGQDKDATYDTETETVYMRIKNELNERRE